MFNIRLLLVLLDCYWVRKDGQQISCNFDQDFCDYSSNEFVSRYTGNSPSQTSGPNADHTTGEEGYYALCEGSKLRDPSSLCKLTINVDLKNETGFQFFYYMYGFQIGTLELIANKTVLWNLTGKQNNQWLLAQVKLPLGNYLLEFSANRSELGRTSSDIAIDDVFIQGQELTTNFVIPTRTMSQTVSIPFDNVINFDKFNDLSGWHTDYNNFKWVQTNGNSSMFLGSFGPGSDYKSITSPTLNVTTNRPTNFSCSIPFCLTDNQNKSEYYCTKVLLRKDYVCGLNFCPELTSANDYGRCDMGYYMMITSDKFEASNYRSRFISPVYSSNSDDAVDFCFSFKYNIYSSANDGFRLLLENYLNPNVNLAIFEVRAPLKFDKWYSASIGIKDLLIKQFRFIFEPIRGSSLEYASISIDHISFINGQCELTTSTETTLITTHEDSTTNYDETTSNFVDDTTSSFLTNTTSTEIFTTYTTINELSTEIETFKSTINLTSTSKSTTLKTTIKPNQTTDSSPSTVVNITTTQSNIVISTVTQDIIGGVMGSIAGVIIIGTLGFYFFKKYKKSNAIADNTRPNLDQHEMVNI